MTRSLRPAVRTVGALEIPPRRQPAVEIPRVEAGVAAMIAAIDRNTAAIDRHTDTLAVLRQKVDTLIALHAPARDVDPMDRELWDVSFCRVGCAHTFTATALIAHGRIHSDLGAALRAAGVEGARQLGKWLRRLSRRPMGNVRLVRVGDETRVGAIWEFQVSQE